MSECRHNNHTHGMLWFVMFLGFEGCWNGCNVELESTKRSADAAERDIRELKSENRSLRSDVDQLQRDIGTLQQQVRR
jgi:peptidoglycan hydrolase CwlO-like protein